MDIFNYNQEFTKVKNLYFNRINKVHLKCIVIDGSLVNGCRETILYSFALD